MSASFFHDLFRAMSSFLQDQEFPQQIFWKSLFTWSYWTDPNMANPATYSVFFILCYAIPAYCLFVWASVLAKANKLIPIYHMIIVQIWSVLIFLTAGVLLYNFSYQQGVAYFSNRILILIIIVFTVLWIGLIIFFQKRLIPKQRQAHLEKEHFFRYLPKKKERILK